MNKKFLFAVLFVIILLPAQAFSWTWTPFQLSVWEPVQLFPETFNVYGFRMNLVYGRNQNLTGFDAGVVNAIMENQVGGQLGLFNLSGRSLGGCAGLLNYTNTLTGGQLGLLNTAQHSLAGFQAGALLNLSDHVRGLQVHGGILGNGAVRVDGAQFVLLTGYNLSDVVNGLQLAMFGFNYAKETVNGMQFAMLYNYAEKMKGLQFGLVNACDSLSGIQIGLVNIIWQEKMSIMPLINFNF